MCYGRDYVRFQQKQIQPMIYLTDDFYLQFCINLLCPFTLPGKLPSMVLSGYFLLSWSERCVVHYVQFLYGDP